MANSVQDYFIPPSATVEELRQGVQMILNRIALREADNKLVGNVDANGNRIMGLADPAAAGDAVNLRTLRSATKQVPQRSVAEGSVARGSGSSLSVVISY